MTGELGPLPSAGADPCCFPGTLLVVTDSAAEAVGNEMPVGELATVVVMEAEELISKAGEFGLLPKAGTEPCCFPETTLVVEELAAEAAD